MKILPFLSILAVIGFCGATARAGDGYFYRDIYRGARSQAMGGAYTAVADDEQAIFSNPAGLASVTSSSLNLLPLSTEFNSDVIWRAFDYIALFSSFTTSTLNSLMGQNVYARLQVAPSIVFPNVGVAIIADQQAGFMLSNPVFPEFTGLFQTTYGVQVSTGFSVLKRGRKSRSELDVGIGGKLLWRRGGIRTLSLVDLLGSALSDYAGFITSKFGGFGMGYGLDLGVLYSYTFKNGIKLSAGSAFTNIGDMFFAQEGDAQRGNLTFGVAARFNVGDFKILAAYDYRNALQDMDWRKKHRLGLEFTLPILTLQGGFNGPYLTYGVAFDLWALRIQATAYTEDLGPFVFQTPMQIYLAQFLLKFPL